MYVFRRTLCRHDVRWDKSGDRHTESQNLNPRSTSNFGFLTLSKLCSTKSKACPFASLAIWESLLDGPRTSPSRLKSVTSRYVLKRIPNPVFASDWNGRPVIISVLAKTYTGVGLDVLNISSMYSSRCFLAVPVRSILTDMASNKWRNDLETARGKELNTSNSRDRGPAH